MNSLEDVLLRFNKLGAVRAFCKPLAENDNSKQQVYFGGSFDVLHMFPFHNIVVDGNGAQGTYKAKIDLFWIDEKTTEQAHGAQLILYPQYPEVRFSGFLRGCKLAPNEQLRPLPKTQRRFNNGADGRVLFFAVNDEGKTYAYLAPAGSAIALDFFHQQTMSPFVKQSVFYQLKLQTEDVKVLLLQQLGLLVQSGWRNSVSLGSDGLVRPYKAQNGGGYTLEAFMGVVRNGRSEPDFRGWELKAFSSSRVTLMTPEPDAGDYGLYGAKSFVEQYGSPSIKDPSTLYFTGTHRVNARNEKTGLTLTVNGFDASTQKITDVNGAVALINDAGKNAAAWTFSQLLLKWNKKHAQAAYVPFESILGEQNQYRYETPVLLGEGTDFSRFISALVNGSVILDPGSKVEAALTPHSKVKARSQFRTTTKQLPSLYQHFEAVNVSDVSVA
jgi:MvaI/BcnI restriction endonuclease family